MGNLVGDLPNAAPLSFSNKLLSFIRIASLLLLLLSSSPEKTASHFSRARRRRRTIKPVPVGRPLLENSRKKRDRFFLEKLFPIFSKRLYPAEYCVLRSAVPKTHIGIFVVLHVAIRLRLRPTPSSPAAAAADT